MTTMEVLRVKKDIDREDSKRLDACPFCGGEARIKTLRDHLGNWHCNLWCRNYFEGGENRCWVNFHEVSGESREDVIETVLRKWNTRSLKGRRTPQL